MNCCLLAAIGVTSATATAARGADAREPGTGVPLVIGQRTIHVFRAPAGMFSAGDRAQAARQRIEQAIAQPGEGWTSVKPGAQGLEVQLDGKSVFLVLPDDALGATGDTPEDLANNASRVLQKVWSEAREARDSRANFGALFRVTLATCLIALAVLVAMRAVAVARRQVFRRLEGQMAGADAGDPARRLAELLPRAASALLLLFAWLFGLLVLFVYLEYSLAQFALTRPAAELLSLTIRGMFVQGLGAFAESLPGMFIAALICILAVMATRLSTELFNGVRAGPDEGALINAHTAPATRRIVNASLWLFAVAMAYPYLPGAQTDAFKGLSVIVGLMVSIGASGVVGQIASGVMIVYTYALKRGEYVRIQEFEGTVTEIGLFVTRLRTGLGEEISLPNTFVLANVTRNYSRSGGAGSYVLDLSITIGYDTPWRQVHAMLLEAASTVAHIRQAPAPYVVQTALSDFYVAYKLVTHVDADAPATRARVASDLHAAIQDVFNRYGVQIMSPHYLGDPASAKTVPEAKWHEAPARPEGSSAVPR